MTEMRTRAHTRTHTHTHTHIRAVFRETSRSFYFVQLCRNSFVIYIIFRTPNNSRSHNFRLRAVREHASYHACRVHKSRGTSAEEHLCPVYLQRLRYATHATQAVFPLEYRPVYPKIYLHILSRHRRNSFAACQTNLPVAIQQKKPVCCYLANFFATRRMW